MAKLSEEEQAAFEKLKEKLDAPDESPVSRSDGRNVDIYIDLGDEAAVERALSFGLLTKAEVEKLKGEDDGDGEDGDDEGRKDEAPRRRLDKRYS